METIEQGLRRIFKNAPHIYDEVVRCAKERPFADWKREENSPLIYSHFWGNNTTDNNHEYWSKLDDKVNSGEEIGPDYPLPPDSPLRQKEVGNWYMCVDGEDGVFTKNKWYLCVNQTCKPRAFLNDMGRHDGFCGINSKNEEYFDLTNPLPHNPETKPTLEDMETKPEQAHEPTHKTETYIQLNEEKFSFSKNSCVVHLEIRHKCNTYHVYHNEIEIDQDNHETLLELQLEAVRFAKKRLNETTQATLEQGKA